MTTLSISPNLPLPLDAVTQRLAFLGKPGSGKSYAASKLAELMYGAGAQFIALDPVGVWYGLRLDGRGKGIPIPVFGGLHGDVPLTPTSGAVFADLIVDRRLSCVLDTSQFEHDTDKARFAAGFANRFFFRMKAAPAAVHLFLEECQEWVPQNPQRGEEHMLHDFTRIDKLGRNFGIGVSLISQRPQEVNKKVLNLTECLFAFQMTGAHERKAIKDWIASVGADENILTTLPTLEVAHAHVYSPQWLKFSEVVKIGRKQTADVSSTPAVGESTVAAKPLTPVDLEQIKGAIADTIEKAKVDDPKELRKEIAALRKQITAAPARTVEKPVVDERAIARAVAAAMKGKNMDITSIQKRLHSVHREASSAATAAAAVLQSVDEIQMGIASMLSVEDSRADVQVGYREQGTGANHPSTSTVRQQSRSTTRAAVTPTRPRIDAELTVGEQKLLDAAAKLKSVNIAAPTRAQVAALASMSPTSSSTERHFAKVIAKECLAVPEAGRVQITPRGLSASTPVTAPPTLDEYVEEWQRLLGGGADRKLYDAMVDGNSRPTEPIHRARLAEIAGMSATSSSTERAFARLIGLDLLAVAGKGMVKAGLTMFPEGLV